MYKIRSYVKDCSQWIAKRFSTSKKNDPEESEMEIPRKRQKLESDDKKPIIETYSTYTVFTGRDGVFQNSLLWRTLGQFLSIADLKAARLVCRNFNEQILTKTNFMDRVTIQLTEKSCASAPILIHPHIQWKNVHVELFYISDNMPSGERSRTGKTRRWLLSHLKTVKMLKISAPKKPGNSDSKSQSHKKPIILDLPLRKILEGPDKLQNLLLDMEILCRKRFHSDFEKLKNSDKFQRVVRNLQEFEIHLQSRTGSGTGPRARYSASNTKNPFSHSMEILCSILKKAGNLEIVKFPGRSKDLSMSRRQSVFDLNQNSINLTLTDLVTSKELRDKLTCINWPLETASGFWTTSSNELIYHSLKSLVLRIPPQSTDSLIKFLEKQPNPLQELDITILKQFPTRLLQAIVNHQEIAIKLNSLRLKTKRFDHPEFGWNFLNRLSSLQDFQLEFSPLELYYIDSPDHRVQESKALFKNLPTSLEKLTLKHFRFGLRKPTPGFSLTPQDLKSCLNPEILTELTFKKCGGLIDDAAIQYICAELKKLTKLDVSGSSLCTDFGFTGKGINVLKKWPFSTTSSLKNLNDLTVLKLRCCGEISNFTCKNGIILPKLKFLDISRNKQITPDGIIAILKNNPNLEGIKISQSAKIIDLNSVSWHPRLASVFVSKEPMTSRLSAPLRRNCSSEDSDASGEASDRGLLDISDFTWYQRWRFHCTCDSDSDSDW